MKLRVRWDFLEGKEPHGSEIEGRNIEEILKILKAKLQRLWTTRKSTDCANAGKFNEAWWR